MNKYFFIFSGVLIVAATARAMDSEKGPDYYRIVAQEEFKNLVHARNTSALVEFFKSGPIAHLGLPDFLLLQAALKHGTWASTLKLKQLLDPRIALETIILGTVYN